MFRRSLNQLWTYFGMILRRFLDVYQCSDSLCSKRLLLRFGGGGGRYRCVAATLLNVIWGWYCTFFVMFFTCSSMLGFRILECFEVIAFMSGVMAKSHGLVCCDWSALLTCGLVSFVRFGLPGMVSYGLDRLF